MYEHSIKQKNMISYALKLSLNFEISKKIYNNCCRLPWLMPKHSIFLIENKVSFKNISLRIGANL